MLLLMGRWAANRRAGPWRWLFLGPLVGLAGCRYDAKIIDQPFTTGRVTVDRTEIPREASAGVTVTVWDSDGTRLSGLPVVLDARPDSGQAVEIDPSEVTTNENGEATARVGTSDPPAVITVHAVVRRGEHEISLPESPAIHFTTEPSQHFAPSIQADLLVGANPRALVASALDGDGRDIVTANGGGDSISVILREGVGGWFQEQQPYVVGSGPTAVAIGDVIGDSHPDAVVALGGGGEVVALPGDGTGVLGAPVTLLAGLAYPRALLVHDLDGDDTMDLVVANANSATVTFWWRGSSSSLSVQSEQSPSALGVGDFNGDDYLDVVVANASSKSFTFVPGVEGAGMGSPTHHKLVGCEDPVDLDVGDLDGDGQQDLVFACTTSMHLLLSRENGPLMQASGALGAGSSESVDIAASAVAVSNFDAHLDGNERVDIAAAMPPNKVVIMRENGSQDPVDWPKVEIALPSEDGYPVDLAIDRHREFTLYVANYKANTVSVILMR